MSDREIPWHLTAQRALFLFLDPRIGYSIFLVALHVTKTTVTLYGVSVLVFALLDRRGYTVSVAWRIAKGRIARLLFGTLVIQSHPPLWRWYDRDE